jgi:hypothetical protein
MNLHAIRAAGFLLGIVGLAGGAQATPPTYSLGLQEDGVNGGDIDFESGSSASISDSYVSYGAWSLITASSSSSATSVLSLTNTQESYTPTSGEGPTLTIWAWAQNLSAVDDQVNPSNTSPTPSQPSVVLVPGVIVLTSGLPVGWMVTESEYYSASNAALPITGDTSGLMSLGSETFTSTSAGLSPSGGAFTSGTANGLYSLFEEISITPSAGDQYAFNINGGLGASLTVETSETPPIGPAAPEISTWAMLGFGFGTIGLAVYARRRRGLRHAI